MTVLKGYVIYALGSTYLWEYRDPWRSPRYAIGEPAHFEPIKVGHNTVSHELGAKFVVWAHSLVPAAEGKRKDWPEYVSAMQRVDAGGKWLAVLLRKEIGPGPVIIYQHLFRDPCGGPHAWKVTDEGSLEPYAHRPAAGYVIDHEEMGEWAWEYRPAAPGMLGSEVGSDDNWYGEHPIPRRLVLAFQRWHGEWSQAVHEGPCCAGPGLDWNRFNRHGITLARQLKRAVGPMCTVIYLRPYEDPRRHRSWNALEVRSDGSVRLFEHRPYWAQRDLTAQNDSTTP